MIRDFVVASRKLRGPLGREYPPAMHTLRTLTLVLPTLLLMGCGLGLSAFSVDDTASPDEEDDDDGAGGSNGGGGNGGGGSDTGLGDGDGDGGGGDNGGGDDGSQDDIAVTGLSPDYGTTAGGTVVEITGGPFDGSAEVYFGSTAGSVVSNTESVLTVRTPSVSEEGLYSVTVRAAAGEGSLESGFVFWTDGTGKTGTLGAIEFTEQVGSYWGGTGGVTFGSAAVYFVAPTDIEWYELFAPTLDTCRNEASYSFGGTIDIYDPGVSSIQLSGVRSMNLSWDSESGYFSIAELTTSQWLANSSYDLQPMTGGGFPEVVVSGFGQTAPTPTLYSPAISGSTPIDISPNPTFSWAATGADWVLITMGIWDSGNTGYQEVINCVARDDGSFRVDTGQFSQWPYSRQIDVYFGPATKATATLPWNNSRSGVIGLSRIYGAGFTWY